MKKNEIQNLIKEIIEKTNVVVKEVAVEEKNPKSVWFSVEVDNPYFFTSRGGEALSALNHLVKRIVETKLPQEIENLDNFEFLIDINGFQKKRIENIHAVAHMMAERARYFKSSIEVEPMSAFDRRVVHEFLSEETDLKTESTGEGISRRVVIKYTGDL
jgi:spoIIIJ-associated protein